MFEIEEIGEVLMLAAFGVSPLIYRVKVSSGLNATLLIEYAPVVALQEVLYVVSPATRKTILFVTPLHTGDTVTPSSL
jgi:hypothetical protein